MLETCNDTFKYDLTTSRQQQMSVLMSESFMHSFIRFIQTADSFRNESIDCPYELATESIDSLDSFKNVDSFRNETRRFIIVAQRHTTVLLWLWSQLFSNEKLSKNSQYFV